MTSPAARDRGLQAERTALSWQRTALSTAAIAALLLHQAAERGWGAATIPALFIAATMLMAVGMCYVRVRELRAGHIGVSRHVAAMFSAAVLASAVAEAIAEIWY